MRNHHIHRRHVLKASGLSLALPVFASAGDFRWLKQANAQQQADTNATVEPKTVRGPKRFCCIFFPNGVSLPPKGHSDHTDWHWFPHEEGASYRFTQTLAPLEEHRRELTILSGLSHPAMRTSIAHITADSFLTGADSSENYTNSISLDQLLASHLGHQTRFPSLTLSSDGGIGAPGRTHTLSFNAAGRPIPSLSSPRRIFNRLFGVTNKSKEDQRREFGRDRSILDSVLEETADLQRSLSHADQHRMQEYTQSVREIEFRLANADRWLDAQRPQIDPTSFDLHVSPKDDAEDYIRVILDLIHVALMTDSTRIVTYQITSEDAKGIGDRFPLSLGLPAHHSLSHGIGRDEGYRQWAEYDQFLAQQLSYFINKLKNTDDPLQDGSLLDNTLVYYGCSTSRTHLAMNYPLILAGGSRAGFTHGRHLRFDEDKTRLSNLYATMLRQFELPIETFADSDSFLSEVVA